MVVGDRRIQEGKMPQAGIGGTGAGEDDLRFEPDEDVCGSEGDFATSVA
jgi:hypothetical protein